MEVPPDTSTFIVFLIIYNLIDSVQAPFWKVIIATGNIKHYEVWLNLLLMLNIPLSFVFLKNGCPPYIVVIVSALINLISAIFRTIQVKIQIGISIREYLRDVILRVVMVSGLYILPVAYIDNEIITTSLFSFLLFYAISAIYILTLAMVIGIPKGDRKVIVKMMRTRFKSKQREESTA